MSELRDDQRYGTQMYYLQDDTSKRLFLSKARYLAGTETRERQTGRVRVYVTEPKPKRQENF